MTTALSAQAMDLAGDILGVVRGADANPEEHDLALTGGFAESLDREVRQRLLYRVVEELEPITQRHDIEGLVMGVES